MKSCKSSTLKNKCSVCQLRSDNYFCNLSADNLKIFESFQTSNNYDKGDILFVEGQPSNGIYILCSGRVKFSTCSSDGRKIILHIALPGEVMGLSETVSDSTYIATAEVVEPSQINFAKNKDFLPFLEENKEVSLNAARQLSRNYNSACLHICALGLSATVADKLATLFLGWCNSGREDVDGIHIKVSYTHEELAQMVGTSRETVTRLLKNFSDCRLIERKGAELIICNKKKLAAAIGSRNKAKPNKNVFQ